MLLLLGELFDLSDKTWLRRQLPTILKQLAGGKISRKVVQTTDWLTSSQQVASYIHDLTNIMWPGGVSANPHPDPTNDVKAIRSLLARAKLMGSIPGNDNLVYEVPMLFILMLSVYGIRTDLLGQMSC